MERSCISLESRMANIGYESVSPIKIKSKTLRAFSTNSGLIELKFSKFRILIMASIESQRPAQFFARVSIVSSFWTFSSLDETERFTLVFLVKNSIANWSPLIIEIRTYLSKKSLVEKTTKIWHEQSNLATFSFWLKKYFLNHLK